MAPPAEALLYLRVSVEERTFRGGPGNRGDRSGSLTVQRGECERYARAQGWPVGGVYADVMSGMRDSRAQYLALLEAVRARRAAGGGVAVVVSALDRLGRRLAERVRVRNELKGLGVPVHSVREGGELTDLVANVLAAVAQEEARLAAERIGAARRHSIERGWFPLGPVPWGYRARPVTRAERAAGAMRRTLEPHPAEAPAVREAFRRYAEGHSMTRVCAWLASLPPEARGGRRLWVQTLTQVLRSPVYVTRQRTGDPDVLRRPTGRWPALVDDAVWAAVRDRRARQELLRAWGYVLLTGFLRCGHCGKPASGGSSRATCRWYACRRCPHRDGRDRHIGGRLTLDRTVLAEVGELLDRAGCAAADRAGQLDQEEQEWNARQARYAGRSSAAARWRALRRDPTARTAEGEIQRLDAIVAAGRRRLAHAGAMLVDGALDPTGYDLLVEATQREMDGACAALAPLLAARSRPLPTLEQLRRSLRRWRALLDGGDTSEQRGVLGALVRDVRVAKLAGWRRFQVTLRWTPLGLALAAFSGVPVGADGSSARLSR